MVEINEKILPKRVQELAEELKSDLKVTEFNIKEKTLITPALKTKWLMLHLSEEKTLNRLKDEKDRLVEEYISKHGKPEVARFRTDKEAKDSESVATIEKAIKNQTEIVRFCFEAREIMKSFGYDLKNAVDIIKMENV